MSQELAKGVLRNLGKFRITCSYCGHSDTLEVTEDGLRIEWPWGTLGLAGSFVCSDICYKLAKG